MINVAKIMLVLLCSFACSYTKDKAELETNRIFNTIMMHHQDSLILFFKPVNSTDAKRVEKYISRSGKPDSNAIYRRSVDTLRFQQPISTFALKQYDMTDRYNVDSLVTNDDIIYWNEAISDYKSKEWSKEEVKGLPILNKRPKYMTTHSRPENTLKNLFYLSTPFFNKKKKKALVYEFRFFDPATVSGRIYILYREKKVGK